MNPSLFFLAPRVLAVVSVFVNLCYRIKFIVLKHPPHGFITNRPFLILPMSFNSKVSQHSDAKNGETV